jgi:hypothetical protein
MLGKTYRDLIKEILNAALEGVKRNEKVNY